MTNGITLIKKSHERSTAYLKLINEKDEMLFYNSNTKIKNTSLN